MAQEFCLTWNNHTRIMKEFTNFLASESMVDVTLACDGRSLKAHKLVLSACSPFFRSLFAENPCKHPIVILKDVKYSQLQKIVQFMYSGEVTVTNHQLSSLVKTAESLRVYGLGEVDSDSSKSGGIDDNASFADQNNSNAGSVSSTVDASVCKREQLVSDDMDDESEIQQDTHSGDGCKMISKTVPLLRKHLENQQYQPAEQSFRVPFSPCSTNYIGNQQDQPPLDSVSDIELSESMLGDGPTYSQEQFMSNQNDKIHGSEIMCGQSLKQDAVMKQSSVQPSNLAHCEVHLIPLPLELTLASQESSNAEVVEPAKSLASFRKGLQKKKQLKMPPRKTVRRHSNSQKFETSGNVTKQSSVQSSNVAQCEIRLTPLPLELASASSAVAEAEPTNSSLESSRKRLKTKNLLRLSQEKSVQQSPNLKKFEASDKITSSPRNVLDEIENSEHTNGGVKAFSSKHQKNHLRVALSRKEFFNCNQCSYKSAIKHSVKRHVEAVHEGLKPFHCEDCDFRSYEKNKLKIHMFRRHGK